MHGAFWHPRYGYWTCLQLAGWLQCSLPGLNRDKLWSQLKVTHSSAHHPPVCCLLMLTGTNQPLVLGFWYLLILPSLPSSSLTQKLVLSQVTNEDRAQCWGGMPWAYRLCRPHFQHHSVGLLLRRPPDQNGLPLFILDVFVCLWKAVILYYFFNFWNYNYFIPLFPFLPPNTAIYPSLLFFKFIALFFH